MGFWSNEEKSEVLGMKELRKTLMNTLDVFDDEMEQILADMSAKEDEVEIAQNELAQLRFDRDAKQRDMNKVQASLDLVTGKRQR
jgi:uncharacterized protein (DUF3084 family)